MTRLIDADALSKRLEALWNVHDDQDFANKDVWQELENAPSIDAVPVVRCKDCKQCRKTILFGHFATVCDYWIKLTDDDGYCNHAERKES